MPNCSCQDFSMKRGTELGKKSYSAVDVTEVPNLGENCPVARASKVRHCTSLQLDGCLQLGQAVRCLVRWDDSSAIMKLVK